ncbi:hypothetical protein DYB32_008219 [Aphanomyces invadans]|nr:hypothetical protein DYB32_008219 [Aphanomyces invadans]
MWSNNQADVDQPQRIHQLRSRQNALDLFRSTKNILKNLVMDLMLWILDTTIANHTLWLPIVDIRQLQTHPASCAQMLKKLLDE